MDGSPPFALGKDDIIKLGKSLALAVGGTVLALATSYVSGLESTHYAWLIPLATVALNMARKFLTDTMDSS